MPPTYGQQEDTTDAAPPDTVQRAPADTTQPPPADSVQQQQLQIETPLYPAPPLYGRPRTDSLPARLPAVSVEHLLAQEPGSFLYDLGAVAWPHGWSPRGLAPHRTHLWLDDHSYDDPLTGRPRFELIPPSFLQPPRTGVDPGGGPVGVHLTSRNYAQKRPITELRYRRNSKGLHAIEVGHSQKRQLSLFDTPGLLQITFGYGGRKAENVYDGSDLRRERRLWGRLRYQTEDWMVELNDRSARYRIGSHGGVQPPGRFFQSIYVLPVAETSVRTPDARRRTYRNDLTARVRAPFVPSLSTPMELSATWTSNTFDFHTDYTTADTVWTVKMHGGHTSIRQSVSVRGHHLTLSGRGSFWAVADGNIPQIDGTRWSTNALVRDSMRLGRTDLTLNAGWHATQTRQHPSAAVRATRPTGPFDLSASISLAGQQESWIAEEGYSELVRPLQDGGSPPRSRVLEGRFGGTIDFGPIEAELEGFAHQINNAVDLYSVTPSSPAPPSTFTDTVAAWRTSAPVQRVGGTLSLSWRRDARRGLYATGHGTALHSLTAGESLQQTRLAQTLPTLFGQFRLGARFVIFQDLITDLYVEGRGWSAMNSRWFHPPTGRLVVPPRDLPIPAAPGQSVGPSGTINVQAEAQLRGATLFFRFENIQAGTELQPGTFVVPVYPLPARQFRFGVFWPIFD